MQTFVFHFLRKNEVNIIKTIRHRCEWCVYIEFNWLSKEIKNGYLHTDFKFRYWLKREKEKDEEMNHFKCFVVNRSEYQSEIKSSMMLFSSFWQAAQLNSNKSQCLFERKRRSSLTNKNNTHTHIFTINDRLISWFNF
jgi:hypothetical protein